MTNDVDRSLREATAWRDEDLDTPQVRAALTEMRDSIKADSTAVQVAARSKRQRRQRRWAAAIAAVIAVPGIALASPAAADWISLRTGTYDAAPGEPKTAENEYWRSNAPEAADRIRAYAREYGMAPGYSIEPVVEIAADSEFQMEAKGFRTWVIHWSECSWTLTAVDARQRDDRSTQLAASQALRQLADELGTLYEPDESNSAEYARMLARDIETGRSDHIIDWNANSCQGSEKADR